MALVGGLISAGTAAYGAYSAATADPTAGGVNVPPPWVMPNKTEAANSAFGGIQNLPGQQIPGQYLPQYEQIAKALASNPYAQMFQQGANAVAPQGQMAGQGSFNAGQQIQGAGQAMVPYAQQIMQTAFDPQQQLQGRLQQQTTDQARAAQAARGVATTPYGAGLENDAMRKFNIDWQNAQLGRQVSGAQGAGGLLTDASRAAGAGGALSDAGINTYMNASGLPYSTYGAIGGSQLAALNQLFQGTGQAQNVAMTPVQAYLNYLGVGNQAGAVANNAAKVGLDQAGMSFDQQQRLGSQFGQGMSGLANAAGKGNWNWLSSFGGGGGSSYNPGPLATWGY